jgi:hypothetical protein
MAHIRLAPAGFLQHPVSEKRLSGSRAVDRSALGLGFRKKIRRRTRTVGIIEERKRDGRRAPEIVA